MLYSGPLSYAFSDPAAVLLLQGVSLATEAGRLGLLLLSGAAHDPSIVTEAAVDGLIVLAMTDDDPLLEAALGRRLPLVLIDQGSRPGVPSVGIDDEGGARVAAAHVLSLGHRRIGIIALGRDHSGPALAATPRDAAHPVARLRLRGYAAATAEAGISWAEIPVFECASLEPANGAEAAAWLLGREPRPTALLAMSDQLALGALDAARELGLNVPDDLSVVGFDDVPAAARAEPALTTVRQPHVEKGRRAARLLLDTLRGPAPDGPQGIILPTELIVRRSTARQRLERT